MRQVKTYKADQERVILTALIVHNRILDRIALNLRGDRKPFRSRWSNIVAKWCFEYHAKYGKAPRKSINELFRKWSQNAPDPKAVDTIEAFLEGLSEDYTMSPKDMNEQFIVDSASEYFRRIKLERVSQEMQEALERNDADAAEACLSSYDAVAFGSADWVDPTDPKLIRTTLEASEGQELIRFRGDLGRFLGPHFERDAFVSFVAPEKRGKSFWLMETAWMAMLQRRRVLYYVIGDMSLHQVMRRLLCRALGRPMHRKRMERPVKLKKLPNGIAKVFTAERKYKGIPSARDAIEAMDDVLKRTGAMKSRLKIRCCGASLLSASDIERDVKQFSRTGWIPDVVVIDYSDLLAPEQGSRSMDYRHQVNDSWKILRRISQDQHLLMVTATQAAATSYDSRLIRKKDFSEDKRKNAHVTGMIGINQDNEEKLNCAYRLNWVFLRDGNWAESQVVHTAGSYELACPCLVSIL